MTTKTQIEKTDELALSCREANLILRVTPLRKNTNEMSKEETAAIKHYVFCKPCRDRGLAEILNTKLSCREAILIWAEKARALWLSGQETIIDEYAVEHVWGKYQWKNWRGGCGYATLTGCQERPCRELHNYWERVPMSSSAGDGPGGVIHLFPFLIKNFIKEGWRINELLAIQEKRISKVIEDIKNNKVTVSSGHYHSIDELAAEILEHVAILQKLALRSQVQISPT